MLNVKVKNTLPTDREFPPSLRFWFFKIAAMVAVTTGAFYIPEGPFTRSKNYVILFSSSNGLEFDQSHLL